MVSPVRKYAEIERLGSAKSRLRSGLRDLALRTLSLTRKEPQAGRIYFPYYHHVFDDERAGFARQLAWMKNRGDFLDLDQAIDLLAGGDSIDGCYFCITFDDGFECCATNAAPLLLDAGASAAFFPVTDMIDTDWRDPEDQVRILGFYDHQRLLVPFLSWGQVADLAEAGMVIGSHTASHAHLIDLEAETVADEMRASKHILEEKLGRPCDHFCCPWGQPGLDFRVDRDPNLAREAGYRSFLTTVRGDNAPGFITDRGSDAPGFITDRGSDAPGQSPFAVRRDHLLAMWGDHQLRYFFGT